MTENMPTIAERIAEHGITLTVVEGPTPGVDITPGEGIGRAWRHTAFLVRLTSSTGATIETPWKQGEAHGAATPEAADVLNALASDAGSWVNARDFADFATDLGFDMSTAEAIRHAEETFEACGKIHEQLAELLGSDEARDALMFETEQL